jgi:D-alanyl-lipoteichoic acid acyltransferase DltB (MBOAT superfamily)
VLFPTATFAIFFLLVLPLSWLTMPHPPRWRAFIVLASYVFYSWWDWRFVFLLAGSTLWNQALATAIHRTSVTSRRKALLILALAGNIGALGYFKYYDFFVSSGDNLLSTIGLSVPLGLRTLILPVGLSFYTFMAISYVVDTYRGDFAPVSLPRFAAYLSFFPHLVAGPIVRPGELLPQMDGPRNPRTVDSSRAFYLIGTGLFKKVVIANFLASSIVDDVFGAPGQHSSLEILVAVYAYAIQIYADFSGYTDMAIGLALLLGFRFPQNFDSPYTAVSIQDFWRRWHMTLSRWLRDYVYVPLGGNRKGELITYRNLLLTMLIGGLWHGAGWTFVAWGGLHGLGLAVGRYRRGATPVAPKGIALWRARIVTFHLVCFAWIFFRADSFGTAKDVLDGLVTRWGDPSPLVTWTIVAAIAVGIASQYLPARIPRDLMDRFARLPVVAQAAVLGLGLMVTSVMGPEGVAPFIYFRF